MDSTGSPSRFGRFLSELRRRHVVRVSIAYGAVGFVALQAAEIVLPAFLSGFEADAALRIVVVAFLVLFPIVVALAWVYEITPTGIRAMEALDAEAGRSPSGSLIPRLALLVFTVLAAGSAGWWWYSSDSAAVAERLAARANRATPFVAASTTDASGPIRSLAVLPLDDYSEGGERSGAYFAAGMHEALISQLSQLGTVRVISRTSSEAYETEGRSLPQVGADLGVDAVVEGSVLRAEGRVRITVQLIHAASDSHLWTQVYERDLEDIIGLQREVAMAIASEIDARIVGGEPEAGVAERVAEASGEPSPTGAETQGPGPEVSPVDGAPSVEVVSAPPVPPELQDFVMRGLFALRDPTPTGEEEAERYFMEALSLDSTFAPALTGLAGAHLLRGLEIEGVDALDELHTARLLATRAVAGDSASMEAREILASTEEALTDLVGRMSETEAPGGRMVALEGDSTVVYVTGSDTSRFTIRGTPFASATEMGRFVQAEMGSSRRQPRDASDEMRSIARLEIAGHQAEALARVYQALERFPTEARLWDTAERLSVSTGALDQVVVIREERADALDEASAGVADSLASVIEARGVAGYWEWRLQELDAREALGERISAVDRAAAHSALGRTATALSLLETARDDRDPRLVSLRTDPVWDPLRGEHRFQELLRSLGSRLRPPRPGASR